MSDGLRILCAWSGYQVPLLHKRQIFELTLSRWRGGAGHVVALHFEAHYGDRQRREAAASLRGV